MPENGHATPDPLSPGAVTALLRDYAHGRREAFDSLFPVIYHELRHIAHGHMKREREGHTLNTTALVHEAYIRLVDITRVEWRDRVHFLSMAARAMRRILIDHARQHRAERRGGGVELLPLEEALVGADRQADTLLALDLALERLAALNERLVRVVEYRFFGGMTEEETAQALNVNQRTVRRDWVKARGWLQQALDESAP